MADEDPELVAEAAAFVALLDEMAQRTLEGTGETVRFTFTMPVETATLAAWLSLKSIMRDAGKQGPLLRPVCLKRESDGYRLADYYRAKAVFEEAMGWQLLRHLDELRDGTHFLLDRMKPPSVEDVIDDDIPF